MHQTAENRIRLVLVDDQVLLRASLGRFLATQPDLELAGECGSADDALKILQAGPVDLVLSDLCLRTERGEDLISAARSAGYKGRFLMVAGAAEALEVCAAFRRGASGIFLKSESPDRLVQAIRLVGSGAIWIDEKALQLLTDRLLDHLKPNQPAFRNLLTHREERVMQGIVGGLTNRKIGDDIGASESAVKFVVQQLFRKAHVRKRGQLVGLALAGSLPGSREEVPRAEPGTAC